MSHLFCSGPCPCYRICDVRIGLGKDLLGEIMFTITALEDCETRVSQMVAKSCCCLVPSNLSMSINLWPVFVEQETAPRNFDLWGSNHLEPIAKKYLTVLLTFKCFCLSNIEWFNWITNIPNIYFNTCYQHSALCFIVVAFSTKCYQIKNEVKY